MKQATCKQIMREHYENENMIIYTHWHMALPPVHEKVTCCSCGALETNCDVEVNEHGDYNSYTSRTTATI